MALTTALIAFTAAGALLFVITYAIIAPFYKSESGWNLMTFMVIVAVLVVQTLYVRFTGRRLPEWVARVDWSVTGLCIWWRLAILLRAQNANRKRF